MAVTVSSGFQLGGSLVIPNGAGGDEFRDFDLTSLANGAIAAAGIHPTPGEHMDLAVWDNAKLKGTPDFGGMFNGTEAALDQLTGGAGNLVMASTAAGLLYYTVADQDGAQVVAPTSVGMTEMSAPDVAALTDGGFVMTAKKHFGSGTDYDVFVLIRNSDGSQRVLGFTPDNSTADDEAPSICALNDGGIAVAWHRDDGAGNTEIRYAVYEANGTVRKAPAVYDTADPVNRDCSLVALADGGFAIVYEESGSSTFYDVAYAQFNAAGLEVGAKLDLTAPDGVDPFYMEDPYATLLSNGMVAISATYVTDALDRQVAVQLVNPATGAALLDDFAVISAGYDDAQTAAAGFGDAGLVVAWENSGASSEARKLQLVRTTTGAIGDNNLTGDDAIDEMTGGAGNDKLRGFDNNDLLDGGADIDTLLGGKGNDTLIGGGNYDILSGAQGKDSFRYLDITDSAPGTVDNIVGLENKDKIDLSSIDANINKGGDQRFQLVADFTGHAAEMTVHYHASGPFDTYTTVELDVNGDSVADCVIAIQEDHSDFTRFVF